MSVGSLDDVFQRLMDLADVPEDARSATLATLNEMKARYPHETPARLVYRARREGAAILTGRCAHGVRRGECISCDPKIGPQFYFTASGAHLHTTPTCAAMHSKPDGATRTSVKRERIEATSVDDGRERCPKCVKASPRPRAPRKATTTAAATAAPSIAQEQTPAAAGATPNAVVTTP